MDEKIMIDNNNIPRITSREVARSSTYQHRSVKQHIEKVQKEKQLSEIEYEKLFKKDFFIDQSNGNKYEQFLVSADGLKALRQLKERYTKCKPLYAMLREAELEIEKKGFMLEETTKLTPEQIKQSKPIEEDLQNENGQIVVSSRVVAERFGKRHDNVVRAIEEKISTNSKLRTLKYFIESSYKDAKGESRKEYLMTRDGFTFIVMGFTGKDADDFKMAYIEAFNKMEEALKNQAPQLPTTYKDALIALVAEVEAKEQLQLEVKAKEEIIQEMQPKVEYHNEVLQRSDLITTTDIAKDLGMSAKALNDFLMEQKVIYRRTPKDSFKPYANYQWLIVEGYADYKIYSVENSKQSLQWTEKGRQFIIRLVEQAVLLNK